MTETDLHISERLRKLLPPLTTDERKQLKENIESDGRVTEPLYYWHDGKRNVVVDGMHRWEMVRGTDIPFTTRKLAFADYDEAELWILNHQLGRRNLLKPSAIRKVRGEMYNRLKRADKGHGEQIAGGHNVTPPAAEQVAEKAGVSSRTVKRDGARVEAMEKLTKAAKAVAEDATDSEVKTLAKLSTDDQNTVARAVRVGQSSSVKEAMKAAGIKPPGKEQPDYGKCPNCAGTRWKEDEEGVACARCHHPHGEPAGDVDEDRVKTQRQKTVKTVEALMRAFDDLQHICPKPVHKTAIDTCKVLLTTAKGWK